ncbi:MAG: tetraacyldisaccharide 4'-kinase [Thermoanaerobaculia bacterium]
MTTLAPTPPRSPWQRFYGAAHRLRARWYAGRAARLPIPVLSIGNLHWGGTGKTPLVAAVAGWMAERGVRVCVLSRGYKSRGHGVRVVAGFSGGPLLAAPMAGDEPRLLAEQLPGVAVVVSPDRAAGGRVALAELQPPPQLFLLDDGFSHLALARDLDLLVLPAADPFGGGRLLPSGRLREPLASAARAQALLLSGPGAESPLAQEVGQALRPFGFAGQAFAAPVVALAPATLEGEPIPAGTPCLLVSGIARPERFRPAAEQAGLVVAGERAFPDHEPYADAALAAIELGFRQTGARFVLTTGKDLVKLRGRLPLPLAELPVRSRPEPAFWTWLEERLASLGLEVSR